MSRYFNVVFEHDYYEIVEVDNRYVRSVLNNYKQILISIDVSRSEICEDIAYLQEKCTAEQSGSIGSKRLEASPPSRTNDVSDPVSNTAEQLEKYRARIDAQLANLKYYNVMEERVRGIKNIFTKLSLVFPLHYRVVYETFFCHHTQDEVRTKLRYAKVTIKTMQDNMTQIITDICNIHKPIEDINRMSPEMIAQIVSEMDAEIYNKMIKIEEESDKNDNWD